MFPRRWRCCRLCDHLRLPNQPVQRWAIDEGHISAARELDGLLGEAARCHDESARGAFGGPHAIQLAPHGDAHLEGAPLFALHEELLVPVLAVFAQDKIDTTVWTAAAAFHHLVTLQP